MIVTANQRLMYQGNWFGKGSEFDGDVNDSTLAGYLAKGVVSPKVAAKPEPEKSATSPPRKSRPRLQTRDLVPDTEPSVDTADSKRRYNRRDLQAKESE